MNKFFFLIFAFCITQSCDNQEARNVSMTELRSVSQAIDRVELIYDKKNPLIRRFLDSAKKDKNNLYTADIDRILILTQQLNDSTKKSIDELVKLEKINPDSRILKPTSEYLKAIDDYERDMPEFLALITDSIENNHLDIRVKISKALNNVDLARTDYLTQLELFYKESNFSKNEIDSLTR